MCGCGGMVFGNGFSSILFFSQIFLGGQAAARSHYFKNLVTVSRPPPPFFFSVSVVPALTFFFEGVPN